MPQLEYPILGALLNKTTELISKCRHRKKNFVGQRGMSLLTINNGIN